jgi:hypothetical protein
MVRVRAVHFALALFASRFPIRFASANVFVFDTQFKRRVRKQQDWRSFVSHRIGLKPSILLIISDVQEK